MKIKNISKEEFEKVVSELEALSDEELKEIVKELNKLAREISRHYDQKPIPYLGWFWRDIENSNALSVSLPIDDLKELDEEEIEKEFDREILWIDVAFKWDYPHITLSEKESRELILIAYEIAKDFKRWIEKSKELKAKYKDKLLKQIEMIRSRNYE